MTENEWVVTKKTDAEYTYSINNSRGSRNQYIPTSLREQIERTARDNVVVLMEEIITKEKKRCGEANAYHCWYALQNKLKEHSSGERR